LLEFDKFNVLDGRNVIDSSIIGIVTSMINKSTTIGIAKEENYLKISIRSNTYDVSELISKIVKEMDAEGGGHTRAGGLVIEEDRLEKFLDIIKKLLEK
jgi:single-stranded DNA-specific DHH superfamily exonuclease